MGLTDQKGLLAEEQNDIINNTILAYDLKPEVIEELKELNKKNVHNDQVFVLYLSSLYYWLVEKEKYPKEFIQNLSSLFWGC